MKAILFVGHGSRLAAGNDEIREFVKQIAPTITGEYIVESCFLEFEAPNIATGIATCVDKGATEVHVIPIILLDAGHSKMHIPYEVNSAIKKYPAVTFTYGQPLGIHEAIFDILITRLEEAGFDTKAKHDDTAILLIARGGSDPAANGDFYKIGRLLWEKLDVKTVECAFMGVTTPLVDEGIERCSQLGAEKVIMLPYFLFTGILMERMEEWRKRYTVDYPELDITLAGYFGFHPKLQEVLRDRIKEVVTGELDNMTPYFKLVEEIGEEGMHHHHHDHDHDHGHHHHHHDHDHDHDHSHSHAEDKH